MSNDTFEDYWRDNKVAYPLPVMELAFKEIAKQAWDANDAQWRARAKELLAVEIPDDAPVASGSFRMVDDPNGSQKCFLGTEDLKPSWMCKKCENTGYCKRIKGCVALEMMK